MPDHSTIVAISSAVGHGARLIVRISGPDSHRITSSLSPTWTPEPSRASRHELSFNGLTFSSWLYSFTSPRSYTGEDLVELHLPGNPLLARLLLDHIIHLGARLAEPGEFTARAYFNGRLDLSEAEGVAAAISASNDQELQAARQLMAGALAKRLRPIMDQLAETLGLLEVGIDFSDEDVTFLPPEELSLRIQKIDSELSRLLEESDRLERLTTEPTIVLVGRPNAGKSTLLNALTGQDRAVVSPTPGTTRDILSAEAPLLRGLVRLIDAAGIEEGDGGKPGEAMEWIESEMRRRALEAVQQADVVVRLVESGDPRPPIDAGRQPDLLVYSKIDQHPVPPNQIGICAPTGQGLAPLRARLDELAFGRETGTQRLALNRRHLTHIQSALTSLRQIQPQAAVEVIAMDLRESLDSLGQVLGLISPDDVLGLVFSRFCIGK